MQMNAVSAAIAELSIAGICVVMVSVPLMYYFLTFMQSKKHYCLHFTGEAWRRKKTEKSHMES